MKSSPEQYFNELGMIQGGVMTLTGILLLQHGKL